MSGNQIDPLNTIPGDLATLPHAIKARDAEVIDFIRSNLKLVQARFDEGESRFNHIAAALADNTRKTEAVSRGLETVLDDTRELVRAAHAGRGLITFLEWVTSWAKPLGAGLVLIAAVVGAWSAIRGTFGM